MGRVIVVNQGQAELAQAFRQQLPTAIVESDFGWHLQSQDVICWLPADKSRVDVAVNDLVTMLDHSGVQPAKLVMKSVAGTADDAVPEQLQQWYGRDAQNVVMDHLYAIKMIDELEFPYTIVRSLPLTKHPVERPLITEGHQFTGDHSNLRRVAETLVRSTQLDEFTNQSIGI